MRRKKTISGVTSIANYFYNFKLLDDKNELKTLKIGMGLYDLGGTQISYKEDKTSEEILGQISGPDNVIHDVVGLDTDYGKLVAFKSSIPSHSDY